MTSRRITLYIFLAASCALAACKSGSSKEAAQPVKQEAAQPADTGAAGPEAPAAAPGPPTDPPKIDIPNAVVVGGNLLGGQPSDEQLAQIARAGYKMVISLRTPAEDGLAEERAKVEALGMKYVSLPIAGAEDLTEANARALDRAIAGASGPVVIHCTTGNRVGALMALRAYHVGGASPQEALAEGKRSGLTSLEPAVREHLGTE